MTSSDFQQGSTEAISLNSTYSLGLATDGYESASPNADEDQYDEIGKWHGEEFAS